MRRMVASIALPCGYPFRQAAHQDGQLPLLFFGTKARIARIIIGGLAAGSVI